MRETGLYDFDPRNIGYITYSEKIIFLQILFMNKVYWIFFSLIYLHSCFLFVLSSLNFYLLINFAKIINMKVRIRTSVRIWKARKMHSWCYKLGRSLSTIKYFIVVLNFLFTFMIQIENNNHEKSVCEECVSSITRKHVVSH